MFGLGMFFNFAFYLTTSTNLYILFRFIYFIWEFSAIFRNSVKLWYGFWSECSVQFFSSFLTNKLFLYCNFKLCTRKIPQKVVYRIYKGHLKFKKKFKITKTWKIWWKVHCWTIIFAAQVRNSLKIAGKKRWHEREMTHFKYIFTFECNFVPKNTSV